MIRPRIGWAGFRSGLVIGVIVAMLAQGCAMRDRSQQVGSIEDYVAQGQNDGYAYGYGPYDPYFNGYDPYLSPWYVAPIYYYPRGDGDNDCDDGNCGVRIGGGDGAHGGH